MSGVGEWVVRWVGGWVGRWVGEWGWGGWFFAGDAKSTTRYSIMSNEYGQTINNEIYPELKCM